MPGNDELFQAFGMLQNSVKGLAVQRAMQDAQTQAQNIRESEGKDFEKLQQYRGVAQGLTMKLAGLGQPASEIKVLADELVPKVPTIQNAEQGLAYGRMTGDQGLADQFQGDINSQYKQQMNLVNAKNTLRISNDAEKAVSKAKGDFAKRGDVQTAVKSYDTVKSGIQDMLQTGNYLGQVQALKGIIKTTDPRISDEDFRRAAPSQDIYRRAKSTYNKLINNTMNDEDVKDIQFVAQAMQSALERTIKDKTSGYAKSRAKRLGLDQSSFESELHNEIGFSFGQPTAVSQNVNAEMQGAQQAPNFNKYWK
jgi:hypothetical protein